AFIAGWFLTLGYICIVALNASAFALAFKFVFSKVIENLHLYQVAGWVVYCLDIIFASFSFIFFVYFIVKVSGLFCRFLIGFFFACRFQFVFCLVIVVSVVVFSFMVGAHPGSGLENVKPLFSTETTAFAAIISIVAIAPWAYVGFDNVPQAAEEFKFSSKKAFTLIILAIFFAALLYALMILATSMTHPWESLVSQGDVWGTGAAIQDVLGSL